MNELTEEYTREQEISDNSFNDGFFEGKKVMAEAMKAEGIDQKIIVRILEDAC